MEIVSENVFLICPEEKSQWWDTYSKLGNKSTLDISGPVNLLEIERGKEFSCGQNSKSWKIYLKIKGQSGLRCDGASLPLMGKVGAGRLLRSVSCLVANPTNTPLVPGSQSREDPSSKASLVELLVQLRLLGFLQDARTVWS